MYAQAMAAAPLEIPLTVKETKGIARIDNPVNSGVPLPKGAVKEASELHLLDADGKVVCASIEARDRWLGDESLKWITVHFIVPRMEPNGELKYKLTTSNAATPKSKLEVTAGEKAITVVTGPAKFVIPTVGQFGPFEQVYVRADLSKDFTDADARLAKPASATLVARNGESKVTPRPNTDGEFKTEQIKIDEQPFTQTAFIPSGEVQEKGPGRAMVGLRWAEIEEKGPGRAVVCIRGTFSTNKAKSLDFVARLYFYNGSALAQMTFSVINRQMDAWTHFVGIDRLAVEVPVNVKKDDPPAITLEKDGKPYLDELADGPMLSQTATGRMTITTVHGKTVEGQRSEGWVQLGGGLFTSGTRWFWQTHPTGLAVIPDGSVIMGLKDAAGERVDLYTGGAKTHFLFFRFGQAGEKSDPASIAAGTMYPLVAACSPDWYCQDTRVFGDLFSANPKLYDPKYQDIIARYQKQIDHCINTIVANRPRPGWKVDEYGWLNFGSGLHDKNLVRENAAESWWDANYYDFPHAAIVNYLRTGDLLNLTTAEEAGLHLADLDICHSSPGRPEEVGQPRSGPVVGHFRNYTSGQNYEGHNSFTFYKNESLYELYYLTGERWYHDVGLMSSDFAMARFGQGALRNLAHGIWGVLSAYQDTHQQKYLDRAKFFVDKWGKPWQDKNDGSFKDQLWMYGLVFEAYDKYYRITGDKDTAAYLVKALDALVAEFWKPNVKVAGHDGINLFGYGLGYEYTGNAEYLNKGLILLDKLAETKNEGDRVKTFAQEFRGSPYFLKYLTVGYKPTPVLPGK